MPQILQEYEQNPSRINLKRAYHRFVMLHTAAIALGSNLGDRHANLTRATELLAATVGISHLRSSEFIETTPLRVGSADPGGAYLNAAVVVTTTLPPCALLQTLQTIEQTMGRDRATQPHGSARVIDLDLVLHGETVVQSPALTLPHPAMHERDFVLRPLAAIAPDMVIPTTGRTVAAEFARLTNR